MLHDKFGVPRQPGLVKSATATLELLPPFNQPEAFRGLDDFSHVWITFIFSSIGFPRVGKSTVRPPRLGGNERIGIFATRSNFRPNPIGLSVVELKHVEGIKLTLGSGDFLDGTPILDIKPYVPYSDSLPNARGAFASEPPMPGNAVTFLPEVEQKFQSLETVDRPNLRQLISDMLSYNPRPAYQNNDQERVFGTTVFDLNIKWKQAGDKINGG